MIGFLTTSSFLLLITSGQFFLVQYSECFERVCVYNSVARLRVGDGLFMPEDIDTSLCSIISYSFIGLTKTGQPAVSDDESSFIKRTVALKRQNSTLKVFLTLSDYFNNIPFGRLVSNQQLFNQFISNVYSFAQQYSLDGIVVDLNYIGQSNLQITSQTRTFLTTLTTSLRNVLTQGGYSLSAIISAQNGVINTAYDLQSISNNVDYVSLATYDYHGPWESVTGHNSPLYARKNETEQTENVYWSAGYATSNGVEADKLIIGIPFYGRLFRLQSNQSTGFGAPTVGMPPKAKYTETNGIIAYYEVCSIMLRLGWTTYFDEESRVSYATNGTIWIGYDDRESVYIKTSFAYVNNYAGVEYNTLDLDDLSGKYCREGPLPLASESNKSWNDNRQAGSTTESPQTSTAAGSTTTTSATYTTDTTDSIDTTDATTTPESTTTSAPLPVIITSTIPVQFNATALPTVTPAGRPVTPDTSDITTQSSAIDQQDVNENCPNGDGQYANKADQCRSFFQCLYVGTSFQKYVINSCPSGLLFNEQTQLCDFPHNVNC